MHFDYKGIGHPTRNQLVDFAESLVDEQACVSAVLASHIAGCAKCAREVKRVRASLELAEMARLPEPSGVLTQSIVLRARAELISRQRPRKSAATFRAAQFAACAVAAIVLAVYSFSTALNEAGMQSPPAAMSTANPGVEPVPVANPASLLQRARAVEALAASLSIRREETESPRETGYRRALEMLDHDVSAALNALQRNPGSTRANQVMLTSLEQQLEGLRDLYLDRTY